MVLVVLPRLPLVSVCSCLPGPIFTTVRSFAAVNLFVCCLFVSFFVCFVICGCFFLVFFALFCLFFVFSVFFVCS